MSQIKLATLERRIAELEHRIAEQRKRVLNEAGESLGSAEVLRLMVQTLESWQERKTSLQRKLAGQ